MKNKISYILIISFLINSIFYFFIYPVAINYLKARFSENNKEKEKLINKIIVVDSSNYGKIKFLDEKEFVLDGKMYDIIKKEIDGDKLKLYCYLDKEEMEANRRHEENIERQNEGAVSCFIFAFFSDLPESELSSPCEYSRSKNYSYTEMNYDSIIRDIPFPPPRTIS